MDKLSEFRNRLSEKPILATIIVLVLYIGFVLLSVLRFYINLIVKSYEVYLLLAFIVLMLLFSFFSLFLIRVGLWLPNGRQRLSEYIVTIKMNRIDPAFKSLTLGLIIPSLILIGTLLHSILAGQYTFDLNRIFGIPNSSNNGFFTFINNISPALWEEIIFRGIILTLILKKYTLRNSIIIDGVLFGTFHFVNLAVGADIFGTIGQVFFAFCFGITVSYLYIKTESLIPCIIAHYVNNALQPLVSYTMITNLPLSIILFITLISLIPMILSILIINYVINYKESS